jgi:hypothetical protein
VYLILLLDDEMMESVRSTKLKIVEGIYVSNRIILVL